MSACQGAIEGGSSGGVPLSGSAMPAGGGENSVTPAVSCVPGAPVQVGRSGLRRLTRLELDNTLRDLLGVQGALSESISPDERVGPFYSNSLTPITDLQVQQYRELAKKVAPTADLSAHLPCAEAAGDAACAASFIQDFGLKAYRRPLSQVERAAYHGVFELGEVGGGFSHGVRLVLQAMLQSPSFLYRPEFGEGAADAPPSTEVRPLTGYELGSRLSYFLWGSMPDSALFQAAAEGSLNTTEGLRAQAARLIADVRARATIAAFHRQWLGLDALPQISKDSQSFPTFDGTLRQAMLDETGNFTAHVLLDGDAKLSTLFAAPFSVIDGPLFELYGATKPAGFSPGAQVPLDPAQRAGIFTQAAFLSVNAHHNQTSPVHRGLVIRQNFMCERIPSPPADADTTPPEVMAGVSTRERFDAHDADPACAGCHTLMDPIGLAFEHYDPIGRYRTEDNGVLVNAAGQIAAANEASLNGDFYGAVELAQRLSQSKQVASCVAEQWFRFALGRAQSNDDYCAMQAARDGFASTGYDLRELIVQLITSPSFNQLRLVGSAEVAP